MGVFCEKKMDKKFDALGLTSLAKKARGEPLPKLDPWIKGAVVQVISFTPVDRWDPPVWVEDMNLFKRCHGIIERVYHNGDVCVRVPGHESFNYKKSWLIPTDMK